MLSFKKRNQQEAKTETAGTGTHFRQSTREEGTRELEDYEEAGILNVGRKASQAKSHKCKVSEVGEMVGAVKKLERSSVIGVWRA